MYPHKLDRVGGINPVEQILKDPKQNHSYHSTSEIWHEQTLRTVFDISHSRASNRLVELTRLEKEKKDKEIFDKILAEAKRNNFKSSSFRSKISNTEEGMPTIKISEKISIYKIQIKWRKK